MQAEDQVTVLEKRIRSLEKENLLLQEKVAFLTRKLYGRSTEQTSSLGIEGQMSLLMKLKLLLTYLLLNRISKMLRLTAAGNSKASGKIL